MGRCGRQLQLPAQFLHWRGRGRRQRHLPQDRVPGAPRPLCRVLGKQPAWTASTPAGTRFAVSTGGPAAPQAVLAGHCSGSIAHGWAPVGALHIHLSLAPGESRSILFGLGYIENPQQEKFVAPGVINKARAHAMMAPLRHRRTDRCGPHCAGRPLGGAALHLPSGIRRGKAEPHGEYLESVPVHGHL